MIESNRAAYCLVIALKQDLEYMFNHPEKESLQNENLKYIERRLTVIENRLRR